MALYFSEINYIVLFFFVNVKNAVHRLSTHARHISLAFLRVGLLDSGENLIQVQLIPSRLNRLIYNLGINRESHLLSKFNKRSKHLIDPLKGFLALGFSVPSAKFGFDCPNNALGQPSNDG